MTKTFSIFLLLAAIFVAGANGQSPSSVLATANGQNFTTDDLPPNTADAYIKLEDSVKLLRQEILSQYVAQMVLTAEAKARKTTVEKMTAAEMNRRIKPPTENEILDVYNANRDSIGNRTLAEMKPKIVDFLRREAEPRAMQEWVLTLVPKYKATDLKKVNTPNLKPTDILATMTGDAVTDQEFEALAKRPVYELRTKVFDDTLDALEEAIYFRLLSVEAAKLGITREDLIAREVSDKMRDFSAEERENLETALQEGLYQKYGAKIFIREPDRLAQAISVDDDPSQGSQSAPITIVMFSDFQCPACSATHPVLKKVMAEFPGKIRFVVRDFPLPSIHANAIKAAEAGNAAKAQGKFFEYIEILYIHQDALDPVSLKKYAADLGLNAKQFSADLDSGKFAAEVKKDLADGTEYGVGSTPTIYVNGVKVRRLTARAFREAIQKALSK